MKQSNRALALVMSGSMMLVSVTGGCATEVPQPDAQPPVAASSESSTDAAAAAPPSADALDQMVAPIALYPDALVAQILPAATYPAQVVEANRWMQQHADLKGDALAQAVNSQSWDPSVKALAQFPSVLEMMDKNLSWTSSLGDAYVNGEQNVLDAVQAMRQRAQQAGNLKSTQQENVTSDGQTIAIEPTDPEVVYVPEYDPWVVYGDPLPYYPAWFGVPGLYVDGPGIAFGLGIGVGVFGGFGWGWHHWGADWHGHDVMHDRERYISHSPTFMRHNDFGHGHPDFGHAGGFPHNDVPHNGFSHGGFPHGGGISGGTPSGIHSSAFSGFNHGGATHAFSARGSSSFGGGASHGGGGFHGGGGAHGGGGGHR
ncbi:MAG: hypothetical protein JWO52_8239 [Gammaproteobacteria bacterium]|nr:hypothetical protein [Gammaproteobacteria bacterium]